MNVPSSIPLLDWNRLEPSLGAPQSRLLRRLSVCAAEFGRKLFLVGGAVRDMLLERPVGDLDLALEGDVHMFLNQWNGEARVHFHPRFHTGTLQFIDGLRVDIAMARQEYYPVPAGAPMVAPGDIRQDLLRRDFTVNAMAFPLSPIEKNGLIDLCGGLRDLHARVLRVLHPQSFADDPSRVLRAVRFEARLDFTIEPETRAWMSACVSEGAVERAHRPLILRELQLMREQIGWALLNERLSRYGLMDRLTPFLQTQC